MPKLKLISDKKHFKKIAKEDKEEKLRISRRTRNAENKAGRAYFEYLNQNCNDVIIQRYSNGRIRLMKLVLPSGNSVVIPPKSLHGNKDHSKPNNVAVKSNNAKNVNSPSSDSDSQVKNPFKNQNQQ